MFSGLLPLSSGVILIDRCLHRLPSHALVASSTYHHYIPFLFTPSSSTKSKFLLKMPSCMLPFLRTIYPPESFPNPPEPHYNHNPRCYHPSCRPTQAQLSEEVKDWPWIPVVWMEDCCSCWVLSRGRWRFLVCGSVPCPPIQTLPSCSFCWKSIRNEVPTMAKEGQPDDLKTLEKRFNREPVEGTAPELIRPYEQMAEMGKAPVCGFCFIC